MLHLCYNGSMSTRKLEIIGNSALITLNGIKKVPAKIDTGAESSSVWASDIVMDADNRLSFCLCAPGSEFYTGERIVADDYKAMLVRNSTGQAKVRYRVHLSVKIGKKNIKAGFTLADRSKNNFPVLIGRRLLKDRFLVDVSQLEVPYPPRIQDMELNAELEQNPQAFHQKHMSS